MSLSLGPADLKSYLFETRVLEKQRVPTSRSSVAVYAQKHVNFRCSRRQLSAQWPWHSNLLTYTTTITLLYFTFQHGSCMGSCSSHVSPTAPWRVRVDARASMAEYSCRAGVRDASNDPQLLSLQADCKRRVPPLLNTGMGDGKNASS